MNSVALNTLFSRFTPNMKARPVAFGWSRQASPDYHIPLTKEVFSDLERLALKPDFVARVAEMLVGESNDVPRFFLVTGTKSLLRSVDRVYAFQDNLIEAVANYLRQYHPELKPFASEDHPSPNGFPGPRRGKQPYGYVTAGGQDHNWMDSKQVLHADAQVMLLQSLAYGPYQHIASGGVPRVADARQYRRDLVGNKIQPVPAPEKILKWDGNSLDVRARYASALMERYAIELNPFDAQNDIPILVFNNHREDGVLHGATKPIASGSGKAFRPLRTCDFLYHYPAVRAE